MAELENVGEGKTDTQPPPSAAKLLGDGAVSLPQELRAEVVPDIIHHRIGGRAGVRVEHRSVGGETRHKRVNGGNDEHALGPLVQVPANVLAQVSHLLHSEPLTVEMRKRLVELLGPWLPR